MVWTWQGTGRARARDGQRRLNGYLFINLRVTKRPEYRHRHLFIYADVYAIKKVRAVMFSSRVGPGEPIRTASALALYWSHLGKSLPAVIIFGISACLSALLAADQDEARATSDARLAQYEGRPRVQALRMADGEKITLDGRLDEEIWKRAAPAGAFTQQDPRNGAPPTERTEVRFVYNADNLYMGVYCYDSEPTKLMGNQILRDGFLSADDRFMMVFDTYLNARTGYFFEMNPSGAMGDSLIGGAGNGRAWDGIWTAKIKHFDGGWIIEVEFPFKTFNFDPNAPAWGVNFQRTVRRKQEEQLWSGWERNQNLQSLRFAGLLTGINEASQGKGLDIRPYFINKYNDAPFRGVPGDWKQNVGVDMYYSITPQLRSQLTINTDFAETEVDQRQVNLTQFPLFFPERRTFFLEGQGFLDFGRWTNGNILPFFSRRIGLNAGQPQRIDYGAKVTGQIGKFDLGALQVRTGANAQSAGEDFSVFRGKRRFFRESFVGGMYTRRSTRGVSPVNGTSIADRHTVGFDFYLGTSRFRGNHNLQFSGFYLWNNNLTMPGKSTAHYGFRVDYPNDRWVFRAGTRQVGEAYDPAVGFFDRRGVRRSDGAIFFQPRPKNNRRVRRYTMGLFMNSDTDLHNTPLTLGFDLQLLGVEFQSGDNIYGGVFRGFERLQFDFNISSGIKLLAGSSYNANRGYVGFNTANRRKVSFNFNYSDGGFYSGTRRNFNAGIGVRPRPGVLLTFDNSWNRIHLPEGNFSTAVPKVGAIIQFGPWKSISNIVQYDNVSRILGWQSRFRYILKPGNDLYVVYQNNWISDPSGLRTVLDRGFATKINFTKRF
jgi:hypothetical protein